MKDTDRISSFSAHDVARLDRKIEDLERLVRQMRNTAAEINVQVRLEAARARQLGSKLVLVSLYGQAAAKRRDTLRASVAALGELLARTVRERDDAIARGSPPRPSEPSPSFARSTRDHSRSKPR